MLFLYIYRLKSIRTDNIHIFTIFAKFIKTCLKHSSFILAHGLRMKKRAEIKV